MTSAIISNGSLYISGKNFRGGVYTSFTILPASEDVFFTQVAVSIDHLAAVDSRGRLWTIGNNKYGKLGLGNSTYEYTDELMQVYDGVKFVACDVLSTAIIDFDGNLLYAGKNFMRTPSSSSRSVNFTQIKSSLKFKFISLCDEGCLLLDENNKLFGGGSGSRRLGIIEDDITGMYQNMLNNIDPNDLDQIQNVRDRYNIALNSFRDTIGNNLFDFISIMPELSFKAATISTFGSAAIDMGGNLYDLERRIIKVSDRKFVSLTMGLHGLYCIDEIGDVFVVGRHTARRKIEGRYLSEEPDEIINSIKNEITENSINDLLLTGRLLEIMNHYSKSYLTSRYIVFSSHHGGFFTIPFKDNGVIKPELQQQLQNQHLDYMYGPKFDQPTQLTMNVPISQLTVIKGTLFLLDYRGNLFVFGLNRHYMSGIGDDEKITELLNVPGIKAEALANQNDTRILERRFMNTKRSTYI